MVGGDEHLQHAEDENPNLELDATARGRRQRQRLYRQANLVVRGRACLLISRCALPPNHYEARQPRCRRSGMASHDALPGMCWADGKGGSPAACVQPWNRILAP